MHDWPGRRYPPSPYPPRTEATARYRDGWDDGWDHVSRGRGSRVLDYERDLEDGPYRHGYRDGVGARVAYEERCREGDRVWRERWAREAREDEARRLGEEGPW